jgi:hypothetical protein
MRAVCGELGTPLETTVNEIQVVRKVVVDGSYRAACSFATSGETEAALEALEECLEAGELDLERWQLDPDLDALRDDERFSELMHRLRDRVESAG